MSHDESFSNMSIQPAFADHCAGTSAGICQCYSGIVVQTDKIQIYLATSRPDIDETMRAPSRKQKIMMISRKIIFQVQAYRQK